MIFHVPFTRALERLRATFLMGQEKVDMPINRRPSSLDGVKRTAKDIAKLRDCTHVEALQEAAKLAGFQNYEHARKSFSARESTTAAYQRRMSGFHLEARRDWVAACRKINPNAASSLTWNGTSSIITALSPFMGENHNHVMLPSGGGVDFLTARPSFEKDCIDFHVHDRTGYVAKPKHLTFERIEADEAQSFFLLELDTLRPAGVYNEPDVGEEEEGWEDEEGENSFPKRMRHRIRRREEVVDLSAAEYVDRGVWDSGHLGYDENDYEVPLPDAARLVVRWLSGKMLFVCKRSLWNLDNGTYDGRHTDMMAREIRDMIERTLAAREDA
jgi:hypothetical protein